MPAVPAAGLAALDALRRQGKLLSGDVKAGREFALLCERYERGLDRPAFLAARAVLLRSGTWFAVYDVAFLGCHLRPNQIRMLDRLQDGLDTLHQHFTAEGIL